MIQMALGKCILVGLLEENSKGKINPRWSCFKMDTLKSAGPLRWGLSAAKKKLNGSMDKI
jgi:hypothetical protein